MQYSTSNVLISVQKQFAQRLLEEGYAVRYQATREVTLPVGTVKGTVTLVPEFPPDPLNVVRSPVLNDGTVPTDTQVMVPAFAISIPGSPKKMRRAGIGDAAFERWLTIYIYGFAYNDFQQRALKDLLYEWLEIGDVRLSVWDYDSNPSSPTALDRMDVVNAIIGKEERVTEIDAIRYFLEAEIIVSFFE